jgi:hypothetical protein
MGSSHIEWRKSTHSVDGGCVEVAIIEGRVAVRDSKNREGPMLTFTPIEWRAFLAGVRTGEFDYTGQRVPKG